MSTEFGTFLQPHGTKGKIVTKLKRIPNLTSTSSKILKHLNMPGESDLVAVESSAIESIISSFSGYNKSPS